MHTQPDKELEYRIRDEIERYRKQKELYEAKVHEIDRILYNIENPLKTAIINVYIDGKRVDRIAGEMFLSHNGLAKRMNKAIERALK